MQTISSCLAEATTEWLGPYLNNVRKILGFLDSLAPCHCPIHATYRHVEDNPSSLPLSADVI